MAQDLARLEAHLLTLNLPADECTQVLSDVREKLSRVHSDASKFADKARLEFAVRLQAFHRRVNGLLGGRIFRDPSWPMLLEIFIGTIESRKISVSGLSQDLRISPTTSLRHIEKMEEEGLVARCDDPDDGRRTFVEPTAKAMAGVARVLDEMKATFCPA